MKHSHFLVITTLAYSFLVQATVDRLPFDYSRDINAVQTLLKKEWPKLFLTPSYDEALIQRMFFRKRPGDTSVTNTTLNIQVLYCQGILAGFITYYLKRSHIAHIELLAIDSAFRNKGYGRYLIQEVIKECKQQGCATVQLYVYSSNPSAIKFYEHLGFSLKANYGAYILLYKSI